VLNYHFNFAIVWRYANRLFEGLLLSLEIAVISIFIGMVIGLVLALLQIDGPRWGRPFIRFYVEFIRNVPLLLLVYLTFYGIPSAVDLRYDAMTSFIVTLSLYSGAYLVEVLRAGLESVPKGLIEAGKSIGLTPLSVLFQVRLPLAMRVALPSLSNTYVSLFKDTSIASAIAVPELAYGMRWIETQTFRSVEVYLLATPIYLVTSYTILLCLRLIERRYADPR